MKPLGSLILIGSILLEGCAGGAIRWQPSLASQVPDSTSVRFVSRDGQSPVSGVALDWERGWPRVITARGDTIMVPDGSALEVRLREKANHTTAGTVIGWAIGVGISYAACPPPRRYCGEEDPTPLLAGGLGALIGSRVKTDWWVSVRWDVRTSSSPPSNDPPGARTPGRHPPPSSCRRRAAR